MWSTSLFIWSLKILILSHKIFATDQQIIFHYAFKVSINFRYLKNCGKLFFRSIGLVSFDKKILVTKHFFKANTKTTSPILMVYWNLNIRKSIRPIAVSLDVGRNLNVYKTFRRHPGRALNILCAFNSRSVWRGDSCYAPICNNCPNL